MSPSNCEGFEIPRKYQRLKDIYNDNVKVEQNEELLLLLMEESTSFDEAIENKICRQAMVEELKEG